MKVVDAWRVDIYVKSLFMYSLPDKPIHLSGEETEFEDVESRPSPGQVLYPELPGTVCGVLPWRPRW